MGELLIILGIMIALILWFRHQRQREHEKFMNDDMSAIQTLDATPEFSGRKPIDVPTDNIVGSAIQKTPAAFVKSRREPVVFGNHVRRPAVLDNIRRDLLTAIENALVPGYRVFVELRLSELVHVESGVNEGLLSWRLSFCICTADTMALVAGIQLYVPPKGELNELHRVFEDIQCPLITVSRLDPAATESVRHALADLNLGTSVTSLVNVSDVTTIAAPSCPLCQSMMRQRRVSRANQIVWACLDYPACKGLIR
jgi:hypothetical protein